ncbi:MAG: ATP-binding protein [Acidobacteria bacterium]|nr:ATP-binding protein [Acidobacteriota bacterium]
MAASARGGWTPGAQDLARVLEEQNPWFQTGEVPAELAHSQERFLARRLHERLVADEPHRFHFLIGPRRVGKTTAMYQTVRHLLAAGVPAHQIAWLNLAHPLLLDVPLGHLVRGFLESRPAPPMYFCLDELSYADSWDLWLKDLFDRKLPVRIVATSSATAILHDRRHESGVGRWQEHLMPPYLFGEYLDLLGLPAAIEIAPTLAETLANLCSRPPRPVDLRAHRQRFLLLGGFPELLLQQGTASLDDASLLLRSQAILRSDAIQKAIYQDIPQAYGIEKPKTLERMLYMLAGQIGGILKPSDLSKSLELTVPTFERYLQYLEHSFVVFTTPNFGGGEEAIQRRGRKLYFVDPAVRNAALLRGVGPLADLQEMGLLLENLVVAHFYALAQASGLRVFHWRQGNRAEVDLVFAHPSHPVAIEVGRSPHHTKRGLHRFLEQHPEFAGNGYVVAPGASPVAARRDPAAPGVLPLELVLVAVSAHLELEIARSLGS